MFRSLRTANKAHTTHTPPPQTRGLFPRGPRPVLASAAAVFLFAWTGPSGAQKLAQPGYAGSEICAACHEDLVKAFRKNPHQQAEARGAWQGKACEACHGPGAKHAESGAATDIQNPAKLAAARSEKICLECHGSQPALRAPRARGSQPQPGELRCLPSDPRRCGGIDAQGAGRGQPAMLELPSGRVG
jgi:hypothetical protein